MSMRLMQISYCYTCCHNTARLQPNFSVLRTADWPVITMHMYQHQQQQQQVQVCHQTHTWGTNPLEGTGNCSSEDPSSSCDELDSCVPAQCAVEVFGTSWTDGMCKRHLVTLDRGGQVERLTRAFGPAAHVEVMNL